MNAWMKHVKATLKKLKAKNPNASLKEALPIASASYHKGSHPVSHSHKKRKPRSHKRSKKRRKGRKSRKRRMRRSM